MSDYAVSYSYRKPSGESGFGLCTVSVKDGRYLFKSSDEVVNFGDQLIAAGKFEPGTDIVLINVMRMPL